MHPTRRDFLAAAATAPLALPALAAEPVKRPRVAVIYTVLRFRSHAFNILENCLEPYLFCGKLTDPGIDVVSFYADQRAPEGDMTDDVAKRYNVRLCKSIDEALCLGGKKLAVDAVISIGEHGEYEVNHLGQTEYPRKRFFDEAFAVMERSNKFVPFFNDKHLSYRSDWAKEMHQKAQRHGFPMHAGSSVPLAQRIPAIELPKFTEIEEAISIHGGGFEVYDFHGLEVLQSMVEARGLAEIGASSVEFLVGDDLWDAAKKGRFSRELAEAALAAEFGKKSSIEEVERTSKVESHGILITYRDGLKGTVLKIGSSSSRWNFACRVKGEKEPRACRFYNGPWGNRNLFKALAHAIQHLCKTRKEPYPIERTLLTTELTEAAVRSRFEGKPIRTREWTVGYSAQAWQEMRENGESWKLITKDTPEWREIKRGGDTELSKRK